LELGQYQEVSRRATARLPLEVDVGQRLPVGVADDEAPPIQLWIGRRQPNHRVSVPWSVEETDACFMVRHHSAYVKFSDTGKSIAPGPGAYKDRD
jgi:hypothetical protein